MEQGQDTPWILSTEHTNTQKRGNGQQTLRLEHHNLIQSMDRFLKTMNQAGTPKQIVYWKQWLSLKNPIPESLKIRVLKRWRWFSRQEWTN
ncbi:PB1-F2 protein [Influenza A virus (A/equine/Kentucky/698/1988(H3N8))]|uniref:Protein PB1-F2 n=7 Tax=H3N8 subtype TaxID=119211 RepID=B0VWQ4_9INFA|nr:PB1-F2 protein [Influenza A virus (A/equine/Kentucky/1/1987(H3N8))]ACA24588.1 PB1-F2 protein [Influenza A virus (A/equine/Kentucky/692/1988(H3N8))]ACA24599.1 PB1-F2 protein [Influenza A virus (A/equine/Kentucky/694/1988(H3N8))]ACA24610.1 PB1-F2 protein [Influenza A virus (A/equine/Kentucky/698/1988(H3N8))]ACA24665.1 PB1-F2 protein [Influenza A virus (A/equine/Tennessee/5/1986(H3N8))]ACD56144.1 PB1-F2 protein [Influenza A virus (A/equine/Kentucky/2/1987(H3N8))]ACF22146.1 PB1-F2 protein [Inf